MNITPTALPDVLLIEPKVFGDTRGFFMESFNQAVFDRHVQDPRTKQPYRFVQDNHSRSSQGVLRGLHYQIQQSQGKLVRVVRGSVLDVAVDLRRSSPNFGKWVSIALSESNQRQLWIPPGFAHGFVVTSESADFIYKTTDYYAPDHERCLIWNDTSIGVDWQLTGEPILSNKDRLGKELTLAETFF